MIRNCRFDLIQYLLFPDDNTQCQPFDQLFHHDIQERNLVETDSSLIQKMEDCHISYNSIVCMLEFPMPAQRLDRCMTIFTRGFHVYGRHCRPHNDSYAWFPPSQPVPIFTSGIGETLCRIQCTTIQPPCLDRVNWEGWNPCNIA